MNRLTRLIAVALLALILAGCGVRGAYNNLDWLMMRWINGQVSLSSEQELAVRTALDDKLQWHCSTQLPMYVAFLRAVESDVQGDNIDLDQLRSHGEQLAAFGRALAERARPDVIDFLAGLSDDQVNGLRESFAERNEEIIAESIEVSEGERQANQVSAMERGMRRFAGRPSAVQRERLERWAAELQPTAELSLTQRLAWQDSFFDALEIRSDNGAFSARMADLLEPGATWSDEFRHRMEYNRERTLEAIVDIHQLSSPRQINRLRSRLDSLASDFQRLSCS
ncbi:MAG: hypothetical protein JJU31_04990 [Wenzhouxiangella sp.]|nr:hypothetical protein [Wenzhouxiangella sp.]TVR93633.1 MAG: hypothetical protein EA418_11760 [Wenzhouxiangellaceae bacterium]